MHTEAHLVLFTHCRPMMLANFHFQEDVTNYIFKTTKISQVFLQCCTACGNCRWVGHLVWWFSFCTSISCNLQAKNVHINLCTDKLLFPYLCGGPEETLGVKMKSNKANKITKQCFMYRNNVAIAKLCDKHNRYWLLDWCNIYRICSTHLMKSVTVNKTITSNFKYRKAIQISVQRNLTNVISLKGQLV